MMKKARSIKSFSSCSGIGIDVSKDKLDIVGLLDKTDIWITRSNTPKADNHFAEQLSKAGYQGTIICESTGHYHLKLAIACEQYGLNLIVINPLQASKHSQAKIRKVKDDPADAHTLATMNVTERHLPKVARITPAKALITLKMGQLSSIEKQLQKMNQSRKQYEETYRELELTLGASQVVLSDLCRELKQVKMAIEKELNALLIEAMGGMTDFDNLSSIPGFSKTVSALVGHLERDVKSADSWVAYMGYDVSVRKSGKWVGRGKITKRGNPYLRKRMYQAAWGACLSYDYIRAHYDTLKAEGRSHVESVIIIARKLLKIAYHVVMTQTKFDRKKSVFA